MQYPSVDICIRPEDSYAVGSTTEGVQEQKIQKVEAGATQL